MTEMVEIIDGFGEAKKVLKETEDWTYNPSMQSLIKNPTGKYWRGKQTEE